MHIGEFEKEVVFHSDGEKVFGTLSVPADQEMKRSPAVVLVHGYASFRDELTGFVEIAEKMRAMKIASLRIDLRGCGKSGVPGRILPFSEWITDVMSAVSFLQSLDHVDPTRIGLLGMSVGGGVVSWVGSIDPRVRCTVALASVADGEAWLNHLWMNRGGKSAWEGFLGKLQSDMLRQSLEGVSSLVPIGDVLAYGEEDAQMAEKMLADYPEFTRQVYLSSPVSLIHFKPLYIIGGNRSPIRFIHSEADTSVPVVHSRHLFENCRAKKDLRIVRDSPHCFWLGKQNEVVQDASIEWLEKHI